MVFSGADDDADGWTAGDNWFDAVVDPLGSVQLQTPQLINAFDHALHVDQDVVLDWKAGELGQRRLDGLAARVSNVGERIRKPEPEVVDLVRETGVTPRPPLCRNSSFRKRHELPVSGDVERGGMSCGHVDRQDDDRVGPNASPVEPAAAADQSIGESICAVPGPRTRFADGD
ncbi:MAG: hypothetical protein ACI8Y4_004945 [Candidatus Poriferisodalaceae bacterium]|jgi:hypothetical protein